ncbi:D-alanyl-D-alanine carboxypeptidase/D-alanyl-D-alanine-endopeptidase [Metabacillus herbersteinensis]|uniref:D-alanyl-D-alanine carboxypeptidase/D-alanyl-D-alanine-endopeptidase n=1 Tax=Metabacillus herbersteinensis TaxID=283816 RepID=A0ABV6GGL0_9BACI
MIIKSSLTLTPALKEDLPIKIKLRLFTFCTFVCAMISSHVVNANGPTPPMKEQIQDVLQQDPRLDGSVTGISIISGETEEIVYQQNDSIHLQPASNLKLFTAATALQSLGTNYTFTTEVLTDGKQRLGLLDGNLYIKGKGDPTLLAKDFDQLAKGIKKNGISVIRGNIIGDDTWYDDERYSIDLPWSDETTYYGAQVSALTVSPNSDFDAGTVIVEVKPDKKPSQKPEIILTPSTDFIEVKNLAKTVSSNGVTDIKIERLHGTNTVTIKGTIPINSNSLKEWIGVWDTTNYALKIFKQSLNNNGIKLLGQVKPGKTPEHATPITQHTSMPLSDLLIPFLKLSNNGHGEVLVKEMGRVFGAEGSWEEGLKIMNNELQTLGINTDTIMLRDGSGVSHVNAVPANEITKLLYEVQGKEWFPAFKEALPVSGASTKLESGTLRNRMEGLPKNAKVSAKTGTLTTVSSLSGYVTSKSGKNFIFSILINHVMDEEKAKQVENQIVMILANQ